MFELIDKMDNLVILLGLLTIAIYLVVYAISLIIKGVKHARRKLRKSH